MTPPPDDAPDAPDAGGVDFSAARDPFLWEELWSEAWQCPDAAAGRVRVLAAGDAGDLAAIERWLAALPAGASGRIFLEVFSPIQATELAAPAGIGVTWLIREQRSASPRPGIGLPRGAALVAAVDGWLSEWLRAGDREAEGYHIWLGARTSSVVNRFWRQLEREVAAQRGCCGGDPGCGG